jgi:hypothetical protein
MKTFSGAGMKLELERFNQNCASCKGRNGRREIIFSGRFAFFAFLPELNPGHGLI